MVHNRYLHGKEGEIINEITSVEYYSIDVKGNIKEVK